MSRLFNFKEVYLKTITFNYTQALCINLLRKQWSFLLCRNTLFALTPDYRCIYAHKAIVYISMQTYVNHLLTCMSKTHRFLKNVNISFRSKLVYGKYPRKEVGECLIIHKTCEFHGNCV